MGGSGFLPWFSQLANSLEDSRLMTTILNSTVSLMLPSLKQQNQKPQRVKLKQKWNILDIYQLLPTMLNSTVLLMLLSMKQQNQKPKRVENLLPTNCKFVCNQCTYEFKVKLNLKYHMQKAHLIAKKFNFLKKLKAQKSFSQCKLLFTVYP